MSAWTDLVNADGSDEWLARCSAALEEVQRETLSRAGRKLRAESRNRLSGIGRIYYAHAADLIDPEVIS